MNSGEKKKKEKIGGINIIITICLVIVATLIALVGLNSRENKPKEYEYDLGKLKRIVPKDSASTSVDLLEDNIKAVEKQNFYAFLVRDKSGMMKAIDVRVVDVNLVDSGAYRVVLKTTSKVEDPYHFIEQNLWGRKPRSDARWTNSYPGAKVYVYVPFEESGDYIESCSYGPRK